LKIPFACLAIAAFAAPGLAQTQPQRWVSFSLGTSQNDHSTVTVKGPNTDARFHGVRWAMHPFESAPYYVVQLGQWSRKDPRWGLAVDFTHSKAIALTNQDVQAQGTWKGDPLPADMPLNTRLQRIRFTNGVNILSVVPIRRFAPPEARIQPYAGAGPAYFVIWSVVEADRIVRHARYHGDGQIGWQAIAGVRGRLDNRLSWNFEVKWTSGAANVPVEPEMRLSTPIRTRHQTVGLAYSF
jgi:hypothetical protein